MNPQQSLKEESLALLGLPIGREGDWENVLEEQVFAIRHFFLSQPVTVSLFVSRIKKLLLLSQIEAQLGGKRNPEPEAARTLPQAGAGSIISLFRWRELCHSLSRTAMARHSEILLIAAEADGMCKTESEYEALFLDMVKEHTSVNPGNSMLRRPDYGALILEIARNGISENVVRSLSEEKARILHKPSFPYHSPLGDF